MIPKCQNSNCKECNEEDGSAFLLGLACGAEITMCEATRRWERKWAGLPLSDPRRLKKSALEGMGYGEGLNQGKLYFHI